MSTRSKFERKLTFRTIGFAIKIPDVGRSLKPFDYVVGIPTTSNKGNKILRFVAIEAKRAYGWTLPMSSFLDHQIRALNVVESLASKSAWVAIGFLDIPKMKLLWDRSPITKRMPAEAYLVPWADYKSFAKEGSLSYADLSEEYKMDYGKIGTSYKWHVGESHPILCH